jgi:phosphoglycolate phosphatase
MRVVLWDIDGTLIRSAGAGLQAMRRAVELHPEAARALAGMRLDGMTDYKIARTLCAARRVASAPEHPLEHHAGQVTREEMDALLGAYLEALEKALQNAPGYEVLPGVHAVMDLMDAMGTVVHALGTGNLERGARLKLTPGGLWERFRFGGYGSDAEERADILRAAVRRAAEHVGRPLGLEAFVVVGDTPRDVAAAHEVGLACVGVTTGRYTDAELRDAGAEDVLASLASDDAAARVLNAARR